MVPDSTNQPLRFVEWQPDWSKPVSTQQRHMTTITATAHGVEQRARRRDKPLYIISFVRSALDPAAFSLERGTARQQLSSPLVCPLWTDPSVLASMTTVDRATLTAPTAGTKFKLGHYAYFQQSGLGSTFRKVVAVGSNYLDLHPTEGSPVGPFFASYTAGARIYPAIVGFRADNAAVFTSHRVNSQSHQFTVEEL